MADIESEQIVKDTLVGALESKDIEAHDDSPSVLGIRNLFRQGKIDKDQFIGGLATLVATGLITKSEFTRLKASC